MSKKKGILFCIMTLFLFTLLGCSSNNTANNTQSDNAVDVSSQITSNQTDNISNNSVLNYGAQGVKNDQNLSLEKMLIYAIQDEYLARGEYEYILATFGDQKPFNNIIKAEEKHIESLKTLFTKYNQTLPEDISEEKIPHPQSFVEALETGVQAEIDNIDMYESFLKQSLPDDVSIVFTELRDASKSHLNSFQRNLNK